MIPSPAIHPDFDLATQSGARRFVDALDLSIHDSVSSLAGEWAEIEAGSAISVYQRQQWIETFLESYRHKKRYQPFIIAGRFNGEIVFILPLALHGRLIRRLKFIGGSHVNFNIAMIAPHYEGMITGHCIEEIHRRLKALLPGVGYIALCCQPETWLGRPNPVITANGQRSGNPAFILDLTGGFEATLARGNAKRKRKKFRSQQRLAEQAGGYEFIVPATIAETDAAIDVFFAQKSRRLKEMGIRDVFSEERTKCFLKSLARKSLGMDEPLLQVFALKVGGQTVAVFGGGFHNRRFSGYFSSIEPGEWETLSPGEMLLYLLVEHLCSRGCLQLDLGAGDERYKQSWSSERIEMYETIVPFNKTAVPVVTARRAFGHLRRHVREDEQLWARYKQIRRLKARILRAAWQG